MIRNYSKRSCRYCNKIFTPTYSKNYFCSLYCRLHYHIDIKGPNDCWPWAGYIDFNGYGVLNSKGTPHYTHRLVYEFKHGLILSSSFYVCHKCDNRFCCNPNHLFLSTFEGNMDDKMSKNRQSKGETHGLSKLTISNVKEIKNLLPMNITQAQIAKRYNVSPSEISRINTGDTWGHLSI